MYHILNLVLYDKALKEYIIRAKDRKGRLRTWLCLNRPFLIAMHLV